LSPERIPDLIKLAVVNKKYDDIFFFYDFSQKIEIQDIVIKKHLAAGLAICGKFLLDGEKKKKGVENKVSMGITQNRDRLVTRHSNWLGE
jgi:hypothetical protein